MTFNLSFHTEIEGFSQEIGSLFQLPAIQEFRIHHPDVMNAIEELEKDAQLALLTTILLGEELIVASAPNLAELGKKLYEMHLFYAPIGGIGGYQHTLTSLIEKYRDEQNYTIEPPEKIDLRIKNQQYARYLEEGIAAQASVCEIIPCGGAADRLRLEKGGKAYPTACLLFRGASLLEHIVRDLQAREALYYQRFGHVIETPIVLMTSHEKGNHEKIIQHCEEHNWFGRSKESWIFVIQPSVPMFNRQGKWVSHEQGGPYLRPGGHGVLWHLLQKQGVLDYLLANGIEKALVRQINNPVAGLDGGLIALLGAGYFHNKAFGFSSCPREEGMHEGVNVIKVFYDKNQCKQRFLSNIEYCDFTALKKVDCAQTFPANANTLFVDLSAVQKAQQVCPFPGLLLNFKSKQPSASTRLESTMQAIADPMQLTDPGCAFLTFNERIKTLVAIKKRYQSDDGMQETAKEAENKINEEACKLAKQCGVHLDDPETITFIYHPALGPMYEVIIQKIRGGRWYNGTQVRLELSDILLDNVVIDGELEVIAEQGALSDVQCILQNVTIKGRCRIFLEKGAHLKLCDTHLCDDCMIVISKKAPLSQV